MTWGLGEYGGDSSLVGQELRSVHSIQAFCRGFAAIKPNGDVVIWGSQGGGRPGGLATVCKTGIPGILDVHVARLAWLAFGSDGRMASGKLVPLGASVPLHDAGIRDIVPETMQDITGISRTMFGAFAALRRDGAVVTWGDADCGGDSDAVRPCLSSSVLVGHGALSCLTH